jgi:hypothetical protein
MEYPSHGVIRNLCRIAEQCTHDRRGHQQDKTDDRGLIERQGLSD